MTRELEQESWIAWFRESEARAAKLCAAVKPLLEKVLTRDGIRYASVDARVKTLQSAESKVIKKSYQTPERELTDIVGLRIVLVTESDVARACGCIQSALRVHQEQSGDKSRDLGTNEVGYRSVHYVCDLGDERTKLTEYAEFAGMFFEIQVRTLLQHAWAEIDHDRAYKGRADLPATLRRRLRLVAGLLETADRELDAIATEADALASEQSTLDAVLTSQSLERSVELIVARSGSGVMLEPIVPPTDRDSILLEVFAFGPTTGNELAEYFTPEFWDAFTTRSSTWVGLVRDVMLFADAEHYFEDAWDGSWDVSGVALVNLLTARYGSDQTHELLERHGIGINPSFD